MTNILQISDDALFVVLLYTTPFDFLSLSQTCSHFYNLNAKSDSKTNKYWQERCEWFWSLINYQKYKPKNYNYKFLFESMVNFIFVSVDKDVDFRIQAYKMNITLNDIFFKKAHNYALRMIINHDNLEMFKIYTCNMNDDDINNCYVHSSYSFESESILFKVIRSEPPAMQIANYLLAPHDRDHDHDESNIPYISNKYLFFFFFLICFFLQNFMNIV